MFSIDDDVHDLSSHSTGQAQFRMVDWLQSWKAPLISGGIVAVAGMVLFQGNATAIFAVFWLGGAIAAWTLSVQLRGFYFDRTTDTLTYPLYCFRRSVPLSQIADANCQIKYGENNPLAIVVGLFGLKLTEGSSQSKRYIVNLSGEFGARRVIFHDKYKRDQFLSLTRAFAPQVRITRWS